MPNFVVTMIGGDKFRIYAKDRAEAESKARQRARKIIEERGKFRHGGFETMVKSVREKS